MQFVAIVSKDLIYNTYSLPNTISYIAIPKLILKMPNQILNEINGIRQFKLNKVPTSNLTRKPDRDTLERFIRASFSLNLGTLLRLVTKMRKIRVRKKIKSSLKKLMYCVFSN